MSGESEHPDPLQFRFLNAADPAVWEAGSDDEELDALGYAPNGESRTLRAIARMMRPSFRDRLRQARRKPGRPRETYLLRGRKWDEALEVRAKLTRSLRREPTRAEWAGHVGVTEKTLREAIVRNGL